jgi:hypothetical protein
LFRVQGVDVDASFRKRHDHSAPRDPDARRDALERRKLLQPLHDPSELVAVVQHVELDDDLAVAVEDADGVRLGRTVDADKEIGVFGEIRGRV